MAATAGGACAGRLRSADAARHALVVQQGRPEPYYPNTRSEHTEKQHPSLPESNDNIRQRNRFVIEEKNIFNEGQVTPPTPSHQGNEGGVKPKGRSIIDQTEPNAEKE